MEVESKLARERLPVLFVMELLTLLAVAPPSLAQMPPQRQQIPQQQFNQPQVPPQGDFLNPAPGATPSSIQITDLLATGRHFIANGNAAQAVAPLTKAIETKPNSAAVYFWRAVAYDEMGEPKKAMHDYSKSLNICKSQGMDSAQLRINLGNSLVKLNYLKEAIYDYQRAIEIEPDNGVAHMHLGRALLFKGDYENAISHLRKCEEFGFNPNMLPYLKALALSGLGQVEDAKRELGQCLTEDSKTKAPLLYKQANQLYKSLSPQ
jgi:Tfp pilus assembly protein PilF